MTNDDFEAFAQLVTAAADAVGRTAPTKNAIMFIFDALKKYSLEQVQGAYRAHFQGPEGRFWPTPSHIVEQIEGKPEDRAALAWALVEKALSSYNGAYESVRFPLPAYHFAIEKLGGWITLSDKYNDGSKRDVAFLAKEFKQFYTLGEKAARGWESVPPYLVGIWEDEGSERPTAKKVRMIGSGELVMREKVPALSSGGDRTQQRRRLADNIAALAGAKRL